jgi:lipid-A-disaccharide synthase
MMKETIDKMIVILPFEKDYFRNKWNWEVEYVGHPLVEEIERFKVESSRLKVADEHSTFNIQPSTKIALLPGSRKQEILKKLPVMLEVSKTFPSYQFIVAKAPGVDNDFYASLLEPYNNVSAVSGKTYDLLIQARAALVTSGTATLETALFAVPEVVCYKGSFLSYQIGKRLVKVKFISLVNLIMDKLVVKELIQHEMNVKNLTHELHELLTNETRIGQLKRDYAELKTKLTQSGPDGDRDASAKAARLVYNFTSGK